MKAAGAAPRERGHRVLLRLTLYLALLLGRTPTRALLYPIAAYFLITSPGARRASRSFLRRALGRQVGPRDLWRHFFTFAAVLLDRVYLLANAFHYYDIEECGTRQALAQVAERGVIVLVAHFGSFEVMRALAALRDGIAVSIVMNRDRNANFMDALRDVNSRLDAFIIDATAHPAVLALAVREALARGHVVGIMADRARPGEPVRQCEFLGSTAALPVTAYRLAEVTGAPLYTCFGAYLGGGRYRMEIAPMPQSRGGRAGRAQRLGAQAQTFAERLERIARAHPYNWFNFYDFWHESQRTTGDH